MTKRISAKTKFWIIVLSAIPLFFITLLTNDDRYIFSHFIIVGVFLLIDPTLLVRAFVELYREKTFTYGYKENLDVESPGPKLIYGCFGVIGGVFFMIFGLFNVFYNR